MNLFFSFFFFFSAVLASVFFWPSNDKTERNPSSEKLVPINSQLHPSDNIDPKFEKYYANENESGSASAEKAVFAEIGRINAEFISKSESIYRQWHIEQQKTKPGDATDKRTKARDNALGELPQRENGALATRAVHKKNHGCYAATVDITDNPNGGVGYFKKGASYDAIVRFSNGNHRSQPDKDGDSRGMAVKLLPRKFLEGKTLPTAEEANNQTLLNISNVNFPVAFMFSPDEYRAAIQKGLKEFQNPTPPGSHLLITKGLAGLLVNTRSRVLAGTIAESVIINPLYQKYHSMVAFRLGTGSQSIAYRSIFAPCETPQLAQLEKDHPWSFKPVRKILLHGFAPIAVKDYSQFLSDPQHSELRNRIESDPNYLKKAAQETLKKNEKTCFNLQLQYFKDEANTPIEDPTEIWLENEEQKSLWNEYFSGVKSNNSNHIRVADRAIAKPENIGQIKFKKLDEKTQQIIETPEFKKFCEDLSFNTWDNAPEEHKPLGVISRMRWDAYRSSVNKRHEMNGVKPK